MFLIIGYLFLTPQATEARPPMPAIGQPAPVFAFSSVVPTQAAATGADTLTPETLKGRVVVLDFFATWCLPCVASIPHTNALIEETKDLPVTFLAVASEPRDVLAPVLEKHPMRATLVLDRDGETYRNYWVSRLPFVVIIGTDGRISGFQHPEKISRADLEKAVKRTP